MKDNTVVRIRPKSRHGSTTPETPEVKPDLLGLENVMGASLAAFCLGTGAVFLKGWDLRQRGRFHHLLLLMAGALMVLIGTFKMAIILMHH